jgi:hypothetical protein
MMCPRGSLRVARENAAESWAITTLWKSHRASEKETHGVRATPLRRMRVIWDDHVAACPSVRNSPQKRIRVWSLLSGNRRVYVSKSSDPVVTENEIV